MKNRAYAAVVVLTAVLLTGCGSLKQPYQKIDYYMLEYDVPAPVTAGMRPLVILVQTFRIAAVYNTTKIVFSDAPFRQDTYHYHRWRANPAEMVTYFLARDLRESDFAEAVFVDDGRVSPTHILTGTVDTFLVRQLPAGWEANIDVSIIVVNAQETDITRRIAFQKTYKFIVPCDEKTPASLAAAMSRGMSRLSRALMSDLADHLEKPA